ncbi:hypothetical protein JOE21_003535 [Desmospora profundinema]|uniref:Uncharacterized protein n=1 Tax=Desmospora profundinema TaxID=1571184 RepID=A0ABU1ISH5_9BACL|nr:hypothetical protein [Desmospora profundinema]
MMASINIKLYLIHRLKKRPLLIPNYSNIR